jgi:hypothetical protein
MSTERYRFQFTVSLKRDWLARSLIAGLQVWTAAGGAPRPSANAVSQRGKVTLRILAGERSSTANRCDDLAPVADPARIRSWHRVGKPHKIVRKTNTLARHGGPSDGAKVASDS